MKKLLIFASIVLSFLSFNCYADYSIDISKAEHTLSVFKDGNLIRQYDIITGKPGFVTPNMTTSFNTISINPTWHLTAKEVKQMHKYPNLARKYAVEFTSHGAISGANDHNPLGKARLNLTYGPTPIRIHGTSEPELFNTKRRNYSSGCIRVLEIQNLVEAISDTNVDWSKEYVIKLDHPIVVTVH